MIQDRKEILADDGKRRECCICYEDLMLKSEIVVREGGGCDKETVKLPGCGHVMHLSCIWNWFSVSSRKPSCPVCRREVEL